jgi:hypothetical protein
MSNDFTKKMLSKIRESVDKTKTYKVKPLNEESKPIVRENMLTEWNRMADNADLKKKVITEDVDVESSEVEVPKGKKFPINKSTPQFGDVREMQESDLVKTIGERVELGDDALVYYLDADDLVLTGKIKALNVAFQFRYNDPSGDGCYIWTNALQMTDKNSKTISKIKDAFDIWSQKIDEDGDLMEKLKKEASKND